MQQLGKLEEIVLLILLMKEENYGVGIAKSMKQTSTNPSRFRPFMSY